MVNRQGLTIYSMTLIVDNYYLIPFSWNKWLKAHPTSFLWNPWVAVERGNHSPVIIHTQAKPDSPNGGWNRIQQAALVNWQNG
jgi:hypothetical protein